MYIITDLDGQTLLHINYFSFQENFYNKCLRYEQLIFMSYEQGGE